MRGMPMALETRRQTIPDIGRVSFDNASRTDQRMPIVDLLENQILPYIAPVWRLPELTDPKDIADRFRGMMASLAELIEVTANLYQTKTTLSLFDAFPAAKDDAVIDERLPCPPLDVQNVELTFAFTGDGIPSFRVITESDLRDDQ